MFPNTFEEYSPTQKIENVLGDLELEGLELEFVPFEVGEEVGTNNGVPEEVRIDRGLEALVQEAAKVDDEAEEVGGAHPSTPFIVIHNPPSHLLIKVSHILPSPAILTYSSSHHYAQYSRQNHSSILSGDPVPIHLTSKTHPFFGDFQPLPSHMNLFHYNVLATKGDIFEE